MIGYIVMNVLFKFDIYLGKTAVFEEKEKMTLTKEEWNEEFKKRCDETSKLHPDWFQDNVKMTVSRDMPKQTDDGWE